MSKNLHKQALGECKGMQTHCRTPRSFHIHSLALLRARPEHPFGKRKAKLSQCTFILRASSHLSFPSNNRSVCPYSQKLGHY